MMRVQGLEKVPEGGKALNKHQAGSWSLWMRFVEGICCQTGPCEEPALINSLLGAVGWIWGVDLGCGFGMYQHMGLGCGECKQSPVFLPHEAVTAPVGQGRGWEKQFP